MELSTAQKRLVELDLKKPEIKAYYEELETVLAAVASEIPLNSYFKSDDGTTYKLVKPSGTFVMYKQYDFERTKREGESRGTLSKREAYDAEQNGFNPLPEEEQALPTDPV